MAGITLVGRALHAGCETSVTFLPRPGPIALRQGGHEVPLDRLEVARTDRGVAVRRGGLYVDLVEHLFAALGVVGPAFGLVVHVQGAEIPLLDGGARSFADALLALGLEPAPRTWRIVAPARYDVGGARYELEPGRDTSLAVEVQFDHPAVAVRHASWDGDGGDFVARVAPARTFGLRSDADELLRAGRARGVDLRAVTVLDDDGTVLSEPGPAPDECARHKLLDLVGDLTLAAGVPLGSVRAFRPGHTATHQVVRMARDAGVLVRC